MSELVEKINKLAQESNKTSLMLMSEYFVLFQEIEKQHESCYGAIGSIRSNIPNYCMSCIAERAYKKLEANYEKKQI